MIKINSENKGKPKRGPAARQFDQLIGAFQQKFGYTRERAGRELKRRLAKRAAR